MATVVGPTSSPASGRASPAAALASRAQRRRQRHLHQRLTALCCERSQSVHALARMNTAVFETGLVELEGLSQAREVLRCASAALAPRGVVAHLLTSRLGAGLLHTVLFHRALGVVRPKDTQLSLFDVVFVRGAARRGGATTARRDTNNNTRGLPSSSSGAVRRPGG